KLLVNQATTLRRHMESFHKNQYHKWCLENSFESKLPGDVQKRNQQLKGIADRQKTLDDTLVEKPKKERVIAYSDLTFQRAAIEWMILTDQPLSAIDHPKYRAMIELAARSTEGVTIPSRKSARVQIMKLFNDDMVALSKRLNV
ncbi:hypothetical protein BC629DRAFT_1244000, partial [Irpex lacteus]